MNHFHIFVPLLLSVVKCENVESEFGRGETGIFDDLINKTLESIRPGLVNLHLKNQNFETGPQEFGNFNGNFSEVIVEGLDKFNVKVINTSLFDINNLTVEESFTARGIYYLNGTLDFPLGKNNIHVFGGGEFSAKFTNFSISIKMKIRSHNGTKIVRDLDIVIGLSKIQVFFKNLMGGGDLEQVFNQLMNDAGLTIFNYYKEPALSTVKLQIIKIITELLNTRIKDSIIKIKQEKPPYKCLP